MGGAQEGIVDDDDLDVNSTKEQQLRQSLLSQSSSNALMTRQKAASKTVDLAQFDAANLQWVKLVIEFFELHYMAIIERKKALKIERFFCNIRRMKIRATFNSYIFKMRGYSMSIKNLPRGVALMVLSYMTKRENLSIVAGLGHRYRSLARDPFLWR